LFEAGTRVPFITYWKGKIEPKKSDALICQIDLLASLAELTGATLKDTDSEKLLDALMGRTNKGRDSLVLEATSRTALRGGNWLMIPPYDGPAVAYDVNIELGNSQEFQLFNLGEDVGQQLNLASSNPEQLKLMIQQYKEIVGEINSGAEQLELK
jgi:arylsulfatase A-like enzyme